MTIWQGLILNGTEVINMPTVVGTAIFNTTDQRIVFGQYLAAASSQWCLNNTQEQLVLGLGTAHGMQFILGTNASIGNDYDHAPVANPTLYIQSATNPNISNNQWLALTHDQTNAVVTTGIGDFDVLANGAIGFDQDPAYVQIGRTGASEPNGAIGSYFDAAASPSMYVSSNAYVNSAGVWTHGSAAHNSATWLVQNGTQYWFSRQSGVGVSPGTAKMSMSLAGGIGLGASAAFVDPGASNFVTDGGFYFSNITANYSRLIQDLATDELKLGVGSEHGRQLVIAESASAVHDFDHAVQTDPTLFVHSATDPDINNTQWVSVTHNQTNAVIATGAGDMILDPINAVTEVCGVGLKTKEENAILLDTTAISLPDSTTGWGTVMIGDNQEFARFRWTAAAAVTVDESTPNVATSDLAGNLCLFDNGTSVSIRNRLGSNLRLRYVIHYS